MKLHNSSRRYARFIRWIALNEMPNEEEDLEFSGQAHALAVAVRMVAYCYDLKSREVAQDVVAVTPAAISEAIKGFEKHVIAGAFRATKGSKSAFDNPSDRRETT